MVTEKIRGSSFEAYPLSWPSGTPRTKTAKRSTFKRLDWNLSLRELREELHRLGAKNVVISTNQRLRADGSPYAAVSRSDNAEPGVAVFCSLNGQQTCFPCDKWTTIVENFRAITLTIAAMRALERYGVGRTGQVFTGFKALPQAAGDGVEDPYALLGIASSSTAEAVQTAYRTLARKAHPDNGGNAALMARLNHARDIILKQRGEQAA